MTPEQLKETLQTLHRDLTAGGPVDPAVREMLRVVEADIHRLLDDPAEAAPAADGVGARLDELAGRFASEHPHLAPALQEVSQALSRMGL